MMRHTFFILAMILLTFCTNAFGQISSEVELANEYYRQGDVDKAIDLYNKLAEKPQNIAYIHNNYLELLEIKQRNKETEKYLKKVRSQFPSNIRFDVDIIDFFVYSNDSSKAEKYYQELEKKIINQPSLMQSAAQYLVNKQHNQFAEKLYLAARQRLKDPTAFSVQLATLYRYTNEKDKMVREYMTYAEERPNNLRYVKNMLQLSLTEEEDLESFIEYLMVNIQTDADNEIYSDLLIWANLQINNFFGAFVQAKAIDRRAGLKGDNSIEIGQIAFENEAFEVAETIFQYIVNTYPESRNYIYAKQMLIRSKENIIKHHFPIDTVAIRSLVKSYDQLIEETGLSQFTLEAYRQKALLHAFYLQEPEKASKILQEIISFNNTDQEIVAQAKLDLGDIFIILEQPWESVLLYYQVEKSHKNTQLGEAAKLKNAKLSYFKGDFTLAQEHLDILKKATRREIANDAMDLSILIKNNTILDSTQKALREYAAIDLLLYQNQQREAVERLNRMLVEHEEHPIKDDVLWLLARIDKESGNYEEAIQKLNQIVEDLPYDILTDDALFEMATIYETLINDTQKAKELYQKLLTDFPGSIYVAEARKRFRSMRGDFVN
ncbi:tetratricopeptide repeat protein [Marivirga sp. S37H4]|uniref:Tetratricopeptide repeat protein n=1 Tax=Marivirga aurantiaca TaxID=2802615 RepID=A0A934X1B6_9BACT|nr:tetratricopeptide repeat protein [Marivirga aurantiaca]MBK6267153.1 tetratricopeptide repeat protein [Marivirga aurantiaca]